MLKIIGRSAGSFLYGAVISHFIGRKSVAQLNYLDFLMANIAGNMMANYTAGQAKGPKLLLAPVAIILSTVFTENLSVKSRNVRKYLEGSPLVIIRDGRILENNLKKSSYNINELMLALRQKDIFNLNEVQFAILETNGRISVAKKSRNRPVTTDDLRLPTHYEGLSTILISDGVILEKNMSQHNLSRTWLAHQLKAKGIKDIKDVYLASLSPDGFLYLDLKADL